MELLNSWNQVSAGLRDVLHFLNKDFIFTGYMYSWCTHSSGIWEYVTVPLWYLETSESQISNDLMSYLRKRYLIHSSVRTWKLKSTVFINFKAVLSPVAFWAFPASVPIMHHHSRQVPLMPLLLLLCVTWSLKEREAKDNPEHNDWFRYWKISRKQQERLWEDKDRKAVCETEIAC